MAVARAVGRGNGMLFFNGSRASVWDDGRALELCLYNDCTTMLMYFLRRIVLLKMVKNQTCYVVHILLKFFFKKSKCEPRGRVGFSEIHSFHKEENYTENCFCCSLS